MRISYFVLFTMHAKDLYVLRVLNTRVLKNFCLLLKANYILVNGEKDDRWLWLWCFFFVFICSVALIFLPDVFTMFWGKPMGAVRVFMTGNNLCQPGGRWCVSFLFGVVVAVMEFFVVVVVVVVLRTRYKYMHVDQTRLWKKRVWDNYKQFKQR